jgi:hypothetical protein
LLAGIALPALAAAASGMGLDSMHHVLVTALFVLAGLYCSISFVCAFLIAKREGWRFLVVLPLVFATYQLPYALGFLLGLFHPPAAGKPKSRPLEVIAASTR